MPKDKNKISRIPVVKYNPKYYYADRKIILETLKGTPYYHVKNAERLMKYRAAGIRWDIVEDALDKVYLKKVKVVIDQINNSDKEATKQRPNMMPDLLTDAEWEDLEDKNAKWTQEYIQVIGHPYLPDENLLTPSDNIAFESNVIRTEEREYRLRKGNWSEEDELEYLSPEA